MLKIQDKIFHHAEDFAPILQQWREAGCKIVFTNGCFDLIHVGHVLYLEEAKSLGDKLVVGLNSDSSVKRLKGPNRPIHDLFNRTHILASMSNVDAVVVFETDDPSGLIDAIMPDILVKGGDWKPEQIVGSEAVIKNGGVVRSLHFIDGYSTTRIEEKIKNSGGKSL